jgi:hypothetical protein
MHLNGTVASEMLKNCITHVSACVGKLHASSAANKSNMGKLEIIFFYVYVLQECDLLIGMHICKITTTD